MSNVMIGWASRDVSTDNPVDIHLLPQCAAAGDPAPRILHNIKAQERRFLLKYDPDSTPENVQEFSARKDIAERIAGAFHEVLGWAKKDIRTELPMAHVVKIIDLSRRFITDDEYRNECQRLEEMNQVEFAKEGAPKARLIHDSVLMDRRNRCRRIIQRFEEQKTQPKLQMELHVIRIGDIAFASTRSKCIWTSCTGSRRAVRSVDVHRPAFRHTYGLQRLSGHRTRNLGQRLQRISLL